MGEMGTNGWNLRGRLIPETAVAPSAAAYTLDFRQAFAQLVDVTASSVTFTTASLPTGAGATKPAPWERRHPCRRRSCSTSCSTPSAPTTPTSSPAAPFTPGLSRMIRMPRISSPALPSPTHPKARRASTCPRRQSPQLVDEVRRYLPFRRRHRFETQLQPQILQLHHHLVRYHHPQRQRRHRRRLEIGSAHA